MVVTCERPGRRNGPAVCTIAAKNFLARARVFAQSCIRHNPGVPVYLLLTDEADGCFDPPTEPFTLVPLREMDVPPLSMCQLAFRYDRKPLAAAVKPLLLKWLLDSGHDRVVLIDADSMILDTLTPAIEALVDHSIVLSPHRLEPPSESNPFTKELCLLRTGTINGGLIGVRDSPPVRDFLRWWWARLERHCRHDLEHGLHLDQRWLDLAPGLFDGVGVLRHPGFNVAYWNLDHRGPGQQRWAPGSSGSWRCHHFHFSGYEPERPAFVSSYAPWLTVEDSGWARPLFDTYQKSLLDAGHLAASKWPYAFGRFDNGVPVAEVFRDIFRDLGQAANRHGDPFTTAPSASFWNWLRAPAPGEGTREKPVSNLWMEIYRRRIDVQREYPARDGLDRNRFLEWTTNSGLREHGIPTEFEIH